MKILSSRKFYQLTRISVFGLAMFAMFEGRAQSVIFPQVKQAGAAVVSCENNIFELSNDLFRATFIKDGSMLTFAGCDAMNLLPSTELFKVKLGDGKTISSADMKMGTVRMVDLVGDAQAAKGSERLGGKALEANFSYGDLQITWLAVLRNGSHYLRTHLDIHANKDVQMSEVVPMIYSVDNVKAGSSLVTVGNTRGAVLASEKLFVGLETPMGLNYVNSSADIFHFAHDRWNNKSFGWTPNNHTPKAILDLGFSKDDIRGTRGYLTFHEVGPVTIKFNYVTGNNRLNIVGVDLVNIENKVVSSDYHVGFTGLSNSSNSYVVKVPKKGTYMLRFFIEVKTEKVESLGSISINKYVTKPVVVYDLAPGQKPQEGALALSPENSGRKLSAAQIGMNQTVTDNWNPSEWQVVQNVPQRVQDMGFYSPKIKAIERPLEVNAPKGMLSVEFRYVTGYHRLNLVGVDLLDAEEEAVAADYHIGFTGLENSNNVYSVPIPYAGKFKLRYLIEERTEAIDAIGNINIRMSKADTLHLPVQEITPVEGVWRRNTVLQKGQTWNIGAVVGLIAPGQQRRSFLSYIERERAVPWRAFPTYISWFELNIGRNNDPNYTGNMNIHQCVDVAKQWKKNLYEKYGTNVACFVWDDGWDQYGTWTFNKNFPNGFRETDEVAQSMNAGIGAWLGPVGGYGESGTFRRNYWKDKGGMQLSNPDYYKVFSDATHQLVNSYDFRFFKFDGISQQWSSIGPDQGTVGEENAEAIISAELAIRQIKPDIFFNTSVGTWASPFWFHVSDAIWRQENDYGESGNQGSERERWITYRDRLVYQNYVQDSPLCPINCLMTHGFILSKYGGAIHDLNYKSIVNELRCSFACGSGMVELYADYALLNSINNGQLWKEISDCIKWQKKNEDVLPDVHWVGGNPWDGSKVDVYGWAAWNGKNACFTLRNGAGYAQTFTTTLREALDIPAYINTTITFSDAFEQAAIAGLPLGKPIDIDEELNISLPAFSVFVYDGVDNNIHTGIESVGQDFHRKDIEGNIYDISGRQLSDKQKGVNIIEGKKYYVK